MTRIISNKLKGVIFTILSAISLSFVYILSKKIQYSMKTNLFLFWWFCFASIWTLIILYTKKKELGHYFSKIRTHYLFFIYYVISESVATFLFFYLVKQINPSVVSFLGSISPLFVAIIAFFMIRERLSKREIFGGIISIIGVSIITYASPEMSIKYTILTFLMIFMYSFNNVVVKKKVKDIPVILVTILRIQFLFLTYSIYVLSISGLRFPKSNELILLITGSLFGPILGMTFLFVALKYIKSTHVSLIKNTQPFMVAILSSFFLKTHLTSTQFIAGTIIIFGISIVVSDMNFGIMAFLSRYTKG